MIDTFAYENPDVIVLFAAGNDGVYGSKSVCAEGQAKNILSVGASLNTYGHSSLKQYFFNI